MNVVIIINSFTSIWPKSPQNAATLLVGLIKGMAEF
jgi:hypothetical protein